jgi:hypothetical protein
MGHPQAFVSFDVINDLAAFEQFRLQVAESSTAFSIPFWSVPPPSRNPQWTAFVRDSIDRCDLMIVLVGEETQNSPNVAQEISLAKKSNVPFFGVYIAGAPTAAGLPLGLALNRTTSCDWTRVGSAVQQLLAEGKHHVFR